MQAGLRANRGFTLVELLIVFALIALVAGFLYTGFINYAQYQRYAVAQTEVASLIKEARQRSLAAENDTTHGVHFGTTTITSFRGASYTAGDPTNVETDLFGATVSTDLTNGVDAIIFARKTGAPSATGTISISSTESTASTTYTLFGTGLLEQ